MCENKSFLLSKSFNHYQVSFILCKKIKKGFKRLHVQQLAKAIERKGIVLLIQWIAVLSLDVYPITYKLIWNPRLTLLRNLLIARNVLYWHNNKNGPTTRISVNHNISFRQRLMKLNDKFVLNYVFINNSRTSGSNYFKFSGSKDPINSHILSKTQIKTLKNCLVINFNGKKGQVPVSPLKIAPKIWNSPYILYLYPGRPPIHWFGSGWPQKAQLDFFSVRCMAVFQ